MSEKQTKKQTEFDKPSILCYTIKGLNASFPSPF